MPTTDAETAAWQRIREKLRQARTAAADPGSIDPQAVLRQRARELARVLRTPDTGETLEIVEFRIGREGLAFEAAWVKEVFPCRHLVPVPGAPPFLAGVVNLRGGVISVVDLRSLLGLSEAPGEGSRVVLFLSDDDMEFGVLAERVEGAKEVPVRDLAPPPPTLPEQAMRYLRGILPGPVSLLDARALLASPQMRVDHREGSLFPKEGFS